MESNVLDLLPIRRGHFRFESGYYGEIWLDLDRLFANPRRIAPLARELAGRLSRHDVEAVVGPLVGGAFLAQMIAAELEAEFAYAEPQPVGRTALFCSVPCLCLRLIFAGRAPANAPGVPFDLSQGGVERGMRPLLNASHGFQSMALRVNRELMGGVLHDAPH